MAELLDFTGQGGKESIIKVIGVGGGGGNAVNCMYKQGIKDVDFAVCNTAVQDFEDFDIPVKVQLGATLTEGLGAGSKPERGREAAIESLTQIEELFTPRTKMVFITAGMGGGTGTGAAPIIAQAAKEKGVLTVGIVTIPFSYEGPARIKQAIAGLEEMQKVVDSLLVIKNDLLIKKYGILPYSQAFANADNILTTAVKSIAEIITVKGHQNPDFADVETVMRNSGTALMGSGEGGGENRAVTAIKNALTSPLLNDNDVSGAKNILVNITFSPGKEPTMIEIDEIQKYVLQLTGENTSIITGIGANEQLEKDIRVSVIVTGFSNSDLMLRANTDKKTYAIGGTPVSDADTQSQDEEAGNARIFDFDEKEKEERRKVEYFYNEDGGTLSKEDAQEIPFGIRDRLELADFDNAALMEAFEAIPAYKRKQKDALEL